MPDTALDRSLHCLRCGYDLRGLPADHACPECGLAVARSIDANIHLDRARPAWLNKLAIGSRLLLTTQLCALIFSLQIYGLWPQWFLIAMIPALALLHFAALILLTWRENRFEHHQPGNRVRIALRIFSLNSLILGILASIVIWDDLGRRRGPHSQDWQIATLVSGFLLSPCWAFTFLYLRRLALRVLDPSLAEHCGIVACGMAASIAAPFAVLLICQWQGFPSKDNLYGMILLLILLVGILLFTIWSTFLMVLFAQAFTKAAKTAKKSWREADATRLQ